MVYPPLLALVADASLDQEQAPLGLAADDGLPDRCRAAGHDDSRHVLEGLGQVPPAVATEGLLSKGGDCLGLVLGLLSLGDHLDRLRDTRRVRREGVGEPRTAGNCRATGVPSGLESHRPCRIDGGCRQQGVPLDQLDGGHSTVGVHGDLEHDIAVHTAQERLGGVRRPHLPQRHRGAGLGSSRGKQRRE